MSDGDTSVHQFRSPGFGRRKTTPHSKGRQLDPTALEEIQALLSGRTLQRDELIEYLHLIQDTYGHLHARHLNALASEMKLSMAEVFEVASFYAHFDLVMEGEVPPPAPTIRPGDLCQTTGSCPGRSAGVSKRRITASAPERRRHNHRSRGRSCGPASRPRHISPAAGRAGICCRPGPRTARS